MREKKRIRKMMYLFLYLYPERELNPHNHYWLQDFKSCASTYSAIRAKKNLLNIPIQVCLGGV